jgi:hypothetical protein
MQLLWTSPTIDRLADLERIHRRLAPLQDIFACWQRAGGSAPSEALAQRERLLGPATLSSASLRLLYDLASQYILDLPTRICWHEAMQSAAETQAVLPAGVHVQKTVSVDMAGQLLLWSCVGEQMQTLDQRRAVTTALALPRRAAKRCSTNPATCRPEEEFAMLPGMISPFLAPLRPSRLVAVVQVCWPTTWDEEGHAVGVSLSLFESLILPLRCFRSILRQYARHAYAPSIRWIEVPPADGALAKRELAA